MSEEAPKVKPETTLYEVGYLLSPLIPEEEILAKADEIVRVAIEGAGATVTNTTNPKRLPLAYQIGKSINHKRTNYREAYFGAIRFESLTESVAKIKASLDQNELALRFIIVNVPRRAELPIVPRRVPTRRTKVADKGADVAKPEISKEEIDKEIEGLLAPAA